MSNEAFIWGKEPKYSWKGIKQTTIQYKCNEKKEIIEYKIHSFKKGGKNYKLFQDAITFAKEGIRGYKLSDYYKGIEEYTMKDLEIELLPSHIQSKHYFLFQEIRDALKSKISKKKLTRKSEKQTNKEEQKTEDNDSDYDIDPLDKRLIQPDTPINDNYNKPKYSLRSATIKNTNNIPSTPYNIMNLNINTPQSRPQLPFTSIKNTPNPLSLLGNAAPSSNQQSKTGNDCFHE